MGRSEEFLQLLQQLTLALGADDPLAHFTLVEHQQGRNAADLVAQSDFALLVDC